MKHVALTLAILSLLFAAAAGLGASKSPTYSLSVSIFPLPRRAPTHAHERCPETKKNCKTCHANAGTSKWASDRLIPPMGACENCHSSAKDATALTPPTENCRICHASISRQNMPVRNNYRRPNIRFSHIAHAATGCSACHKRSAAGLPPLETLDVIGMKECFQCHKDSACRTCHLTDKNGKMISDFGQGKRIPPTWLKGMTHGGEWVGTHAVQAGSDSNFCAACHTEAFCRDCHSGARRPRKAHPGDWLTNHGVNTRLDNPNCQGCHRAQSFCITCHRRAGVAPDSPPNARPQEGTGRYHREMDTRTLMRRAKQNIVGCVSCHSESSCITCHVRYNPHPKDFARRCKTLAARNRNACVKCHTNDASQFCR